MCGNVAHVTCICKPHDALLEHNFILTYTW